MKDFFNCCVCLLPLVPETRVELVPKEELHFSSVTDCVTEQQQSGMLFRTDLCDAGN